MFIRAGARYCVPSRADRDLDLGREPSQRINWTFPCVQFLVGTGLDRIGHEQTFETAEPCSHLTCF